MVNPLSLQVRTGMGFDLHAFGGDGPIVLGCVTIPCDKGLVGHSDADVVSHAVTDAFLGAFGLGDIGEYFPNSDPQWAGKDSRHFLTHALGLVNERGWSISNVDCTVICETPQIAPHREKIRTQLAATLAVQVDQVSVKAATTEHLGALGRKEGIAALAIATFVPDQT